MRLNKDDILEALGIETRGAGEWLAPAMIGLGVGAILGAAVTLLIAPRSGEELREDLLERGRRAVQRGRERAEELRNETRPEPH